VNCADLDVVLIVLDVCVLTVRMILYLLSILHQITKYLLRKAANQKKFSQKSSFSFQGFPKKKPKSDYTKIQRVTAEFLTIGRKQTAYRKLFI
jgi:hypothetical protein